MSEKLDFFIFYSQLIVSDEAQAHVLQDWTKRDDRKGFSRKPGSVSFGTLWDVGDLKVEVRLANGFEASPDAAHAVVISLSVSHPRSVMISDCIHVGTVSVPPGSTRSSSRSDG